MKRLQSGYSLAELMVVLAIIGMISLVSVPQFINYQRNNQLKSSMRHVMNDLRLARQKAVVERTIARVRFRNNNGSYTVESQNPDSSWRTIVDRTMEKDCSFASPTNMSTVTIGSVNYYEVTFTPTGTARVPNTGASFRVRTSWATNRTYYTIEVHVPGLIKSI